MITSLALAESGYRKFTDTWSAATECWQKRITAEVNGETRILYWINLYLYTFDRLDVLDGHGAHKWELKMSFECNSAALPYTWITCEVNPETTVVQIEQAADHIWRANLGKIYE